MGREIMSEVTLCEGKYRWYVWDNGILRCQRHGEEWREFLGDKAVYALYEEAIEAREELQAVKTALRNTQIELEGARSALRDARVDAVIDAQTNLQAFANMAMRLVNALEELKSYLKTRDGSCIGAAISILQGSESLPETSSRRVAVAGDIVPHRRRHTGYSGPLRKSFCESCAGTRNIDSDGLCLVCDVFVMAPLRQSYCSLCQLSVLVDDDGLCTICDNELMEAVNS